MKGMIKLDAKQDIMKEIERQLDMGLCNLPPESKCLLKIDTSELLGSTIESHQYWYYVIEAMRTAGKRAMKLSGGNTTSWNEIMSNGKFNHLPAQCPLDKTVITTKTAMKPSPKKQGKD